MKEYSLVRSNRYNGGRKKPLLGALFVSLIGATLLLTFSSSLRSVALSFFAPLWRAENVVVSSAGGLSDTLSSKDTLIAELHALRKSAVQSDMLVRRFRILEEENIELKRLLGRQFYESAVLASVLGRPAATPYDTLLIDVGENSVAVGDRVVVEGSIVLGTVSEVHKKTAQVVLFSAPGVETQVLVGPERIPVTARGQGGGSFIAEFPREAHIEEGYTIVLPGINPFLFATVASTEVSPSDAFVTVRFNNPVNFQALTWVQVITDSREFPSEVYSPVATTTPQNP